MSARFCVLNASLSVTVSLLPFAVPTHGPAFSHFHYCLCPCFKQVSVLTAVAPTLPAAPLLLLAPTLATLRLRYVPLDPHRENIVQTHAIATTLFLSLDLIQPHSYLFVILLC